MEELSLQAENCIKEVFYEGQKSETHTHKNGAYFMQQHLVLWKDNDYMRNY